MNHLSLILSRTAERQPEHLAIVCGTDRLTYAQLVGQANRIARTLRRVGVQPGDRVGHCTARGTWAAAGLHGILRAGAAYVPLDPLAPPARTAQVARDCGITHVIADDRTASLLERAGADGWTPECVIGPASEAAPSLRTVPSAEVNESSDAPLGPEEFPLDPDGRDLAYVLYTSGSTGTPKGVAHTHASASAFARAAQDVWGIRASDRLLNHAPLHFDLSTVDYFAAMCAGATTVVAPFAVTRFPASLAELIERDAVTVLYMVPLAYTQLVERGAIDQRSLDRVRLAVFAGEPFPPRHLRRVMVALPSARFMNFYGPTETNGVTWHVMPGLPHGDDAIPIGRAMPNVELVVTNTSGEPVTVGEPGELWVHGPTNMQEYWNHPELTAARFGYLPGPDGTGRKFVRTGDRVRDQGDGVFEFLGRLDDMVKVRGFRVELREVEAAVEDLPGIAEVAAYTVDLPEGSRGLGMAVAALPGHTLDEDALRARMAGRLPHYAIPDRIRGVDALPRTRNGKVDRVTLAEQAQTVTRSPAPTPPPARQAGGER